MNDLAVVSSILTPESSPAPQHEFTFLTNYAHVLLLIAADTHILMRELAASVGITERAIQRIVEDLTLAGYLVVTKDGRRNHYQVRMDSPLRHQLESHCKVGDLINVVFPRN
jgi:DNA-binding transcriptional regulator PaaX